MLRLDEEGRICLPEPLRKVLGWEEGTLVTAEVAEAGQLILRPLESEPLLVEKEGILVVRNRVDVTPRTS